MKNDSGPAFPIPRIEVNKEHVNSGFWEPGMSLRDWFAGQALVGVLASESADWDSLDSDNVKRAFKIANAMLAEREKENDSPG